MSRPKLRITTLCSGLIAEQRLRQRAVRSEAGWVNSKRRNVEQAMASRRKQAPIEPRHRYSLKVFARDANKPESKGKQSVNISGYISDKTNMSFDGFKNKSVLISDDTERSFYTSDLSQRHSRGAREGT